VQQAGGELRTHRPGDLDPGERAGQVERLGLADLDLQVPVFRHPVQHDNAGHVAVRRPDPDDLTEAHLHETGVRDRGHDVPLPQLLDTIFARASPAANMAESSGFPEDSRIRPM
jgi:hypothetical protein